MFSRLFSATFGRGKRHAAARITLAVLALAGVSLLVCCAARGNRPLAESAPCSGPAFRLVGGLEATAAAIGPHTLVTASHALTAGPMWLACEGSEVSVVSLSQTDAEAAVITTKAELPVWLEVGAPELGRCLVLTTYGVFEAELINVTPTRMAFVGFEPISGDSGSPVLQDGRIVAVVVGSLPGVGLARHLPASVSPP